MQLLEGFKTWVVDMPIGEMADVEVFHLGHLFCVGGGEVRKVWPNLPEVVGAKDLPCNPTLGKSFNSETMLWREWADAICPRRDVAQIAVSQGIGKRKVGYELFYCEVGSGLERVFLVVHSVSLNTLDIDVKPN